MKGDDYRQQELAAMAQVARDVETFVRLFYESQVNQQGFMTEAYRLLQAQSREVEEIREQALRGEDLAQKLDEMMGRLNLLPNILPHLFPEQQTPVTGGQPGMTGGAGQPSMQQPSAGMPGGMGGMSGSVPGTGMTGAGGTTQMQPSGGYTGPGPAKMGQPGAGGFSGGYAPQTGGMPGGLGGMSGSVPGAGMPGGMGGMSGSVPGAGGTTPMQPSGGYTGPGPAKMGQPGAGGFSGGYMPQTGGMPGGLGGMSGSVPGAGMPGGLGGMSGSMPGAGMPGGMGGMSGSMPGAGMPGGMGGMSGSVPGTAPTMPGHIISGPSQTMPGTSHTMPSPTHTQESIPIPLAEPGPEAVPVLKPVAERQAEVRFLHASPDAPAVDIYVDHRKVESYVPYQALSHYMPIETGRHRVQVFPAGVSVGALVDTTVDFKPGRSYTIAAGGVLKEIRSIVVEDDRAVPKPGFARLKIVHLAPNAPAVDITLPSGKVLLSHLTFKEKSPAIQVAPGTRELDVRLAGKPEVVLKVPKIRFEPNASYTLYITGLVGREPGLSPLVVRE